MNILLTKTTLAISELKKDPMCAADKVEMCILNRNKPAFYTVSPERMAELLNTEKEINYFSNSLEDMLNNMHSNGQISNDAYKELFGLL